MKPHIIITLHENDHLPKYEYWEDIIDNKEKISKKFIPEIDELFKKYNVDFFVAQNYKCRNHEWSKSEIQSGLNRIYRIVFTENRSIPNQLICEISMIPSVDKVESHNISTSILPEQIFSSSKSLSAKYVNNSIYLKEAHQFTQGNADVKIAILDTGIETDHPELQHKFIHGKDFVNIIDGAQKFVGDYLDMDEIPDDCVGHGTHVAGIIVSNGNKMPLGVAPKCFIMPLKVLGALKDKENIVGAGLVDDINTGIKYAVDNGAEVINMSLGIKHSGGGLPHEEVIHYALENNVTVVAASGNEGKNDKYYPGALDGVIAVGASDDAGNIAPFSTFGSHVLLIAPGTNVYSTSIDNNYALASGTSQAAPFVSGAIALLKSYALEKGKKLGNDQVRYILENTCDKYTNHYKDEKAGYGRLNILDALKLLQYNL